jgi:hypothetical protein
MKEKFKDVEGFEGIIQIGNKGNFRKLPRTLYRTDGTTRELGEQIVSSSKFRMVNGKKRIVYCSISVDNKQKVFNYEKLYPFYFGPRNEKEAEMVRIYSSQGYKDVKTMMKKFNFDFCDLKELRLSEVEFYAESMELEFKYLLLSICDALTFGK